ncbi:MAG: hypothetical protein ACK56I_29130, partial [bacterium]
VQGQIEGLASYHFESETACFISYAAAPDHWTLDDGSRPPEQKHFSDVSYNPLTRTFTGKIDWSPQLFGGDQTGRMSSYSLTTLTLSAGDISRRHWPTGCQE